MITSYTQLIAKRYQEKLDNDAREFMHFAVDGALRMQKLIQGLLEYSRVGTRGRPFAPCDGAQILDGVLANLKLAIEESQAGITRDVMPTVMGDPVQLAQLFQNLIGNALKFRGAAPPRIHIGVERKLRADAASLNVPPYEWIFEVRDNGIGIEPQYFERIFAIFQRLHTQEQYSGTGIGLAICKKIVERHGGRIWIDATPGPGVGITEHQLARIVSESEKRADLLNRAGDYLGSISDVAADQERLNKNLGAIIRAKSGLR
jgi:light-regulated signal transduction histidine kinase (bacteriophytochrome)